MTKAIPRLQPRKKRQNLSGNATLVIVEGQKNISQISPTTTETSVHSFFEDKEPILFRL